MSSLEIFFSYASIWVALLSLSHNFVSLLEKTAYEFITLANLQPPKTVCYTNI